MRNHSIVCAFIGVLALAMTACVEKEKEPKLYDGEFPKKQLIEEFTGQDCGYCPMGMDYIHEFIKDDANWVVILHHDGYKTDNLTVSGSSTITKKIGVQGAPSMSINRDPIKLGGKNQLYFHPAYLEDINKNGFDSKTYASIDIANTYNADDHKLHVTVSGQIGKADYPSLTLTVLVKESGIVDYQSDYNATYEGWQEFRHCNAVRAFLTDAQGDPIYVKETNRAYKSEFDIELDAKWNAANCMVVAFLSENEFKPVVQVNESPVVSGTNGGANIQHGGITRVPVADYYPESSATAGPKDYSGANADTLTTATASYKSYNNDGFNYWTIMAYDPDASFTVNKTKCLPFAYIYIFTKLDETTIPNGTYPINNSIQPGTVYAGYRDDVHFEIGGSEFFYTSASYFKQGYLVPAAQWLISDGAMIITDNGWELKGHARNGAVINLYGSTPIQNNSKGSAPAKKPQQNTENLQGKYLMLQK